MTKKLIATLAVFLLVGTCVLGAGFALESESGIHNITPDAACPAVGCVSGECHDYNNIPTPNGEYEMICPEAGCASVECHAWDALQGRYKQASDASLNLWILAPVVLVVGLIVLINALSAPKKSTGGSSASHEPDADNSSEQIGGN